MTIDKTSKILVIEDNIEERLAAEKALAEAGHTEFKSVETLADGLALMPQFDAVLSDLFFPAGDEPTEKYIQRFLPVYETYKRERFFEKKDSALKDHIYSLAKVLDYTPEQYLYEFICKTSSPETIKECKEAVLGINDIERYEKFLKIEEDIRNGSNLPLGIIAAERAKELKIPVVIITSTNHHDMAFSPVERMIKGPCLEGLVDGRKYWTRGIDMLMR